MNRSSYASTHELVKAGEALASARIEASDDEAADMLKLLTREIRAMVEIMTGRPLKPAEWHR